MLLYETRKWDIRTRVMDPSAAAPGRLACDEFVQGDLMDYQTVMDFGKGLDLLTIEIENVNVQALQDLEKSGVRVHPGAHTLQVIQTKVRQKLFYRDHDIPTAPFHRFAYTSEIRDSVQNGGLTFPFVWKSAQFGYDGQGVKIVRKMDDLEALPNVECLAEDLIPFENELAVIVARNPEGETCTYPVVEMEFHPEANQVEYVLCPARIPDPVARKAREVALRVSQALGHVGLLAVELFRTPEDEILVNEVAPRPHNSGHYSIEGSYTNQFEQHLRAVLGLPLGKTESKVSAVMVNLVGAEGYEGPVHYQGIEDILKLPGVTPHIYGKHLTRPFRKMGHVTIVDPSIDQARQRAADVKERIAVISKQQEA
jgi:5-(carboxyamino)imidazole ribonucleotide synthase